MEQIETLIIGGGQAGLTMSDMLRRRGCPHLVLERHRIAERWRSERWDGLRFQFPNWSVRLPDFPFAHNQPDGFATSGDILDFILGYAAAISAPVRDGVAVTGLRRHSERTGFIAETSAGPFTARNVVVATGPFQRPAIPARLRDGIGGLFQVHSSAYRAPDQLPPGAVLVIGAGASGAQIAEELARAGRAVFLAVGTHRRMPRRYRGRDLIGWLETMGLDQTTVAQRGPVRALPLITGAYGGHTINFRDFAARGITLLGRVAAARDSVLDIASDLAESLAGGDTAYHGFLDEVDAYIARHGLDCPAEPGARATWADPACLTHPIRRLELRAAGISAVIWATGYAFDYGWIDAPVLDARGEPVHRDGVSDVPGLYFLGLPWLSRRNSSFLSGVGDDAARLAGCIAAR